LLKFSTLSPWKKEPYVVSSGEIWQDNAMLAGPIFLEAIISEGWGVGGVRYG